MIEKEGFTRSQRKNQKNFNQTGNFNDLMNQIMGQFERNESRPDLHHKNPKVLEDSPEEAEDVQDDE